MTVDRSTYGQTLADIAQDLADAEETHERLDPPQAEPADGMAPDLQQ